MNTIDIEYKEFIGLYRNVYPNGYCQHMINEFERLAKNGAGTNRQKSDKVPKHFKDDVHIGLYIKQHSFINFQGKDLVDMFFDGLQVCFEDYTQKFSVAGDNPMHATTMKMQRVHPGGGYHLWHGEHGNNRASHRVITYMLYLNTFTPEQAGETEFLYQQIRLRPEENTMVLWPASYTHAHRGNTVYGQDSKYIITGWFNYE